MRLGIIPVCRPIHEVKMPTEGYEKKSKTTDEMAQEDLSDNIFRFQELARIIDATLANVNRKDIPTGNNTMRIITFLADFPGMKEYIGDDFYNSIPRFIEENRALPNADGIVNFRGPVKKILMYPKTSYPEWKNHGVPSYTVEVIEEVLSDRKFHLEIVNGPLFAVLEQKNFSREIYYGISDENGRYDEKDYEAQDGPDVKCHVSLVPSNVVAEIGESKVQDFVNAFVMVNGDKFGVEFVDLKSTFSEDWSRFGHCLVMGVRSDYIDEFLSKFNAKFNRNIKPCLHITIASVNRDLFPNMENPNKKVAPRPQSELHPLQYLHVFPW